MQIPILIEPIEGSRYRARAGEPFVISAEGASKQEAYQNLERAIFSKIQAGADLLTLEVPLAHPLTLSMGVFKDDPLFDEMMEIIQENRRREDAENP